MTEPKWIEEAKTNIARVIRACAESGCGTGTAISASHKLAQLVAHLREVRAACGLLRSACDDLMGDSDIDGDDSPEMSAMLAAAKVLARPEPPEVGD